MPPNECVRFDNDEHGSPVDQPGEQNQRDARRIVGSAGSDATFRVKRQLLSQEEILGCQLRARAKAKCEEPDHVDQDAAGGPPDRRRDHFRMRKAATTNRHARPLQPPIPANFGVGRNICGSHPTALQTACDARRPADIQGFFDRWSHRLPWPMTPTDRATGFDHRLSISQLEISLTQVVDRPVHGRHFFEAVIRENLDAGRPDRVRLLFPLRLTRTTPPPRYHYRTRVITDGVQPSLHVDDKHSHVKQYFKEQHALRTETTINSPNDFYVNKRIDNLPYLRELGHQINRKLLDVERISHHCVLMQDALDRLQRPTAQAGQRVSALRFGDPRMMARAPPSHHELHASPSRLP
jgi:hypothetical protein